MFVTMCLISVHSKRAIAAAQFRQRANRLVTNYTVPKEGQSLSRLQKLVRGMPKRLERAKANGYGRCGK